MKHLFFALFILTLATALQAQTTTSYPVMIKVNGGTFTMGGTESDEKPLHSVTVNSFSIGKFEITVAEYKAFCKATGRT